MDYQLEHLINAPAGAHPLLDALMHGVANGAELLFLALIAAWFLYGWAAGRPCERQGALTALVAALGALAVVQLIDRPWARPRPFVAHPGAVHLLVAPAADASFPSDHVTAATAIALVLMPAHRRLGLLALAFVALLAYARVYVGVHYPGDVAGGILVGLVVGGPLSGPAAPLTAWGRVQFDRLSARLHPPPPGECAATVLPWRR